MKHWAYIGIGLIVGNASLLGGARAAELSERGPFFHQPGFDLFSLPSTTLWKKPLKKILSPVTLRLFSEKKLATLWLKNTAGFQISGRKVKGPVYVSIYNQKLSITSGGRRLLTASELAVSSLDDKAFELRTLQGKRKTTRGELTLRVVKDRIVIVNRLEIEDYVSGIVEGELGSLNLNPEILKAQIVVARTYFLALRGDRHQGQGYEFCDRPHCQVFGGVPSQENKRFEMALMQVRGQYLSYKGRPIGAFYHHNCGGITSAVEDVWPTSSRAYLKARPEAANSACRTAAKSAWRVSLSKKSLATCFQRAGWLKRGETLQAIQVIRKDRSGRVQELLLQTSQRPVKVTVGRFRNVVNQYYGSELLKSAMFTPTPDGDSFIFKGRGWGHGVGLCQEGAMWMARHGKTYKQILQQYFPRTEIASLR